MSQWFDTLFDMGGYGLYVWGSVAFTLAVLAWNLFAPWLARRRLLASLHEADDDEPTAEEDHT